MVYKCPRGAMAAHRSSKPGVAGSSPAEGYAIKIATNIIILVAIY